VTGRAIQRGDLWWADLDPVVGHEQERTRPVLVVSTGDHLALPSALVSVVPLTRTWLGFPSHVRLDPPEADLSSVSYAMTEQFRTVSRQRFGRQVGTVEPNTLTAADRRLRWLLGL
jgi:mRNA interferase MazF